jgi:hypothetical protein
MFVMKNLFALLIVSSLGISGCMSQMQVKPEELTGSQVYTMNRPPSKPIKIAVADFSLKTGKPANEIGEAKTGMFNVPAPIRLEQPANLMVSNAIRGGLSSMGHQIVALGEADYNLDGTIETIWVEEYATGMSFEYAKANVKYDVILRDRNGKSLWGTSIEVFKTSGKSLDATHDDLPTLRAALDESVSKLLEDASFWNALLK